MNKKRIYEVVSGYTIPNHTQAELDDLIDKFNNFIKLNNCTMTIYKLNSSFRSDKIQNELENKFISIEIETPKTIDALKSKLDKLNIKYDKKASLEKLKRIYIQNIYEPAPQELILGTNLDILQESKKRKTPTIFLAFENYNEDDLDFRISELSEIIELKLISREDWIAHKFSLLEKTESWIEKKDKLILDNESSDEISVAKIQFKRNVPDLWLRSLFFNTDFSYSIRIEKPSIKQIKKTRDAVKKWSDSIPLEETNNSLSEEKAYMDKDKKRNFLSEFMTEESNLVNIKAYVIFKISKESNRSAKKQIKDISSIFENRVNENNFKLQLLEYEQTLGLKRFFGLEDDYKYYPVTARTIASTFPFENTTLMDVNGLYLGEVDQWFEFYQDPRNKENKNALHTGVLGQTGSGKSVLLKLMLMNELALYNSKMIILDPHNEYNLIADKFGGEIHDVLNLKLNPLKILNYEDLKEDKGNRIINGVALSFKSFLTTAMADDLKANGNASALIREISDELRQFLIKKKNILNNGTELTLSDFDKSLTTTQKKSYGFILNSFIKGTLSSFNTKENFSLNKMVNVVQLKSLQNTQEESFKKATFKLLFMRLVQMIYGNESKDNDKQEDITMLIDEAADFFRDDFLLNLISPIFKDARKFNTKLIWGTQNLTDLLGDGKNINPLLVNIWSNTIDKFIGTLDGVQIELLENLLKTSTGRGLNVAEKRHITTNVNGASNAGNFLFTSGRNRNSLKVAYVDDIPAIIEMMLTDEQQKGGI